jgi:hypothetical protein
MSPWSLVEFCKVIGRELDLWLQLCEAVESAGGLRKSFSKFCFCPQGMKRVCSKNLLTLYQTTWRHISADISLNWDNYYCRSPQISCHTSELLHTLSLAAIDPYTRNCTRAHSPLLSNSFVLSSMQITSELQNNFTYKPGVKINTAEPCIENILGNRNFLLLCVP